MNTVSNIFKTIVSFFLFSGILLTGQMGAATAPKTPAQNAETVMFFSDFQGADREENFTKILAAADVNPGMAVGGGDYQSTFLGSVGSAFGIYEAKKIISARWNYNMEYLLCAGNHDEPMTKAINKTGLYETDNYFVYIINENDFPWKEGDNEQKSKGTVSNTAKLLETALSGISTGSKVKPVFVVSHLPLHYTTRSSSKDNAFAGYIFDVLNKYAASMPIVYLYGHNHSSTYDDYIGGAVNYLGCGDKIHIGGTDEEKTLNFVYTNCGYCGYSNNSDSNGSTSSLTATFATVDENSITFKKFAADGLYMTREFKFSTALKKAA